MNSNEYILIPHFYRLNWAREMSAFLACSHSFIFTGDLKFGNYKKAAQLRDSYLNNLLQNKAKKSVGEKADLFFVNLNDFIFYERMHDLKNEYNIYGFMRGSRFFDSEPGNDSANCNLSDLQKKEIEGLALVDGLFLGSSAFHRFLVQQNPSLSKIETKVVGIPIFKEPCYLNKTNSEKRAIKIKKEKDLIIWNHRLQKQKNPWVLFLLDQYIKKNMAICTPEALSAAYSKEMKSNENIFRYIVRDNGGKRQNYLDILERSEYVLSTSEHETWGNSVIEAVMCGAVPILPNGELCSYKELFPQQLLYPQNWINKNVKPEIKKLNAALLSSRIKKNMQEENHKIIEDIQSDLWSRFNFRIWLKGILE